MSKFNLTHFRKPRAACTPGYFWIMNAPMERDLLFAQLEDFHALGAKSVCLHPSPRNWAKYTSMSPDYLSDAYMEVIRQIVEKCAELDMCFYLYDEGGFPSGSAAGAVFLSNPHAFATQGFRLAPDGKGVEYVRDESIAPCAYPNMLAKGATETFLALTHERFEKYVGKHFGKQILYTFTDEPRVPKFPMDGELSWCDDFSEVFLKRKGYRIEPYIADILQGLHGKQTKDRTRLQHTIDYFDVLSQLFVERYFLPIRKWTRAHRLLSGGHMSGENSTEGNYYFAFGHILRCLRAMDLPGVDVIWRQIYPKTIPPTPDHKAVPRDLDPIRTGAKSHPFTKYASSVAHQAGRTAVLSETFAVYGAGLSPDIMRFLTDYQLVRGATRFVISNLMLEIKGGNMIGCRPYFGRSNPLWDYFDLYHAYTARACEAMSSGKPEVDVAFYHDIQSVWCGGKVMKEAVRQHNTTAEALLARQCDFDFIDDDVLGTARVRDGALRIGKMAYRTVVIPHTDWMTPRAQKRLEAFRAAGGRVLFPEEIHQIEPVVKVEPRTADIRVAKRRLDDGEYLYFIASESPRTLQVALHIKEDGDLLQLDAETGHVLRIRRNGNEPLKWTFTPYHSVMLLAHSKRRADADFVPFAPKRSIRLKNGWTLQALKRYYVGEETFMRDETPGEIFPVELGDWRQWLGEEFSGEACYRIEFEATPDGNARLSLGKVNYACTAILNGCLLGRRFWGPFEFDIPRKILRRHNMLEIRVTNTFANAVGGASANEIWERRYPDALKNASYERILRQFEPDSFPSGLFGPVTLQFER